LLKVNKKCSELNNVYFLHFHPTLPVEFPHLNVIEPNYNMTCISDPNQFINGYYETNLSSNRNLINQIKFIQYDRNQLLYVVKSLDNFDDLIEFISIFSNFNQDIDYNYIVQSGKYYNVIFGKLNSISLKPKFKIFRNVNSFEDVIEKLELTNDTKLKFKNVFVKNCENIFVLRYD
jgi:hypothetical protein